MAVAFAQHDLGHCDAGVIVEVVAARQARAYLMDDRNADLYRRGRPFRAVGSPVAPDAPCRLTVPSAGRWRVIVDLNGARGAINASVRKVDPTAIRRAPLSTKTTSG